MSAVNGYTLRVAAAVAIGGFLMGFDASVISGVVSAVEAHFQLSKLALGWVVASLSLTAALGMLLSGPAADRFGRRPVMIAAGMIFLISALASALAPTAALLIAARMLGGLGVGAALVLAPIYIAELAPAGSRGRLVSLNQLNIVVGISAAFFSNYVILRLSAGTASADVAWRWMLGVEALPAVLYLAALARVPESPRWLLLAGREAAARAVLARAGHGEAAMNALVAEVTATPTETAGATGRWRQLASPALRRVLIIGLGVAILQQATGINAIFFYAPMIFEQSGIGTDTAFLQAALVGLTNLLFTLVAIALIDRLGRRPLLLAGTALIAAALLVAAWGFAGAVYMLDAGDLAALEGSVDTAALAPLVDRSFDSDVAFKAALRDALGEAGLRGNEAALVRAAITVDARLILFAILAFVAAFAVSLGPVMWVLLSEIFPNRMRGLAVSVVGLVNSAVSFTVQLVFPWELAYLGNAMTFLLFGVVAAIGLIGLALVLPETRGRTLEELERTLAVPPTK